MASRPTPYGTFAACGVGVIGERTVLDLPDPASWRAHTQLDADYLEQDLQVTADGELVVMHDDTLDRTTDGKGRVDEHTLDEVKQRVIAKLAPKHEKTFVTDNDYRPWRTGAAANIERTFAMVS